METLIKTDTDKLREMSTADLVRHALEETKLLAKAEILHARQELREELAAAKISGILLGMASVLGLSGLTLLFAAGAMALPLPASASLLLVGVVLGVTAGICGVLGAKRLPKKPLPRTQERLRRDLQVTREQLT